MIHKITRIHGACDVEYKCGTRIWIPPNNGPPYYTQSPYFAKNRHKFIPCDLTDEQNDKLLLDIKLHVLAKERA